MTEKFGLKQVFRQGRTVYFDHRHLTASSGKVQRLGHQFFAGAAFPCDKNRRLYAGQGLDKGIHTLHRLALADKTMELLMFYQCLFKANHTGIVPRHHNHTCRQPLQVTQGRSPHTDNLCCPTCPLTFDTPGFNGHTRA